MSISITDLARAGDQDKLFLRRSDTIVILVLPECVAHLAQKRGALILR